MLRLLRSLWREEDGQDIIEYTLLIFFVVMVTAGVFGIGSASIAGIVNVSNSQITAASQQAGG